MSAVNDYVLQTAVAYNLITAEQSAGVAALLASTPEASAVEVLFEQQLIDDPHRQWFYQEVVPRASAAPAPAQPAAQAAPAPAAPVIEVVGEALVAGTARVDDYLRQARKVAASDLHLGPDVPPIVPHPRRDGAPGARLPQREAGVDGR